MYLGIEIGGTKLQLALGAGTGHLVGTWRGRVDRAAGANGILQQIERAYPELLEHSGITRSSVQGCGIGYGGPTDDATQSVIKSHHVSGWNNFPLSGWCQQKLGLRTVVGNDADIAGLGEALFGAGVGYSPLLYITIGSGIGGGLIIHQNIYRGVGKGACELGHLLVPSPDFPGERAITETFASGWGIEERSRKKGRVATVQQLGQQAQQGDELAIQLIQEAVNALGDAIRQTVTLLCPARIILGGGVSLLDESLLLKPLRSAVRRNEFAAFAGLTEIVSAKLGEEVVLHGALALARRQFAQG